MFSGAFVKLRKATIGFVIPGCPYEHPSTWNNAASTKYTFLQNLICEHCSKIVRKNTKL